ncbi:MFS transporter [Hoyosella subflava]|uniref:Putative MFS transporter n=1 Tax=Hoyosella subflava (strain DSM 45089 / JCM 17490 / NBRC 109087 / DQS3-9A1) TaxID=443218 RepID=F6EMB9_HOYSD|nr:MFS transporter [Hoyosella subflava]AEF40279.1 Putative MFS transporter [Hoyosella subflava DQS3-9A1]
MSPAFLRSPLVVWGAGLIAYVVAVLNRTSLGVAGLEATQRYEITAGILSSFVVLQVVVYAAMQIPSGVLLDRYGSRIMITTGAVIMGAGQVLLALSTDLEWAILARVLVGLGDALIFIAVIRLIPQWFPSRQVPVVTQLTGILGQSGQVLSAVPLLLLLRGPGWLTAYLSVAALSVLVAILALVIVRNDPLGREVTSRASSLREVGRTIFSVWRQPGTRLGFYAHMGTSFSGNVFVLLWGFPFLVTAQELSEPAASVLLTVFVVATIAIGPTVGALTARYPLRRSWLVIAIIGVNVVMWTLVLLVPWPAPYWLILLLVIAMAAGGPGSIIGFDYARTFNDPRTLGVAQGMVNQGGFSGTLVTVGAVGLVLTLFGEFSAEAFRAAWLVQYPIWAVAIIGVLATRRKARRDLAAQGVVPRRIRDVLRRKSRP